MQKKCKVPCEKLHRMDRDIKRILWRIQAFKQNDICYDEHKCIYIVDRVTYKGFKHVGLKEVRRNAYQYNLEQPCDRECHCRGTFARIEIIKARKF